MMEQNEIRTNIEVVKEELEQATGIPPENKQQALAKLDAALAWLE